MFEFSLLTIFGMLTEKLRHADTCPLLTCADAEDLLAHFLPRRDTTEKEVLRKRLIKYTYGGRSGLLAGLNSAEANFYTPLHCQ